MEVHNYIVGLVVLMKHLRLLFLLVGGALPATTLAPSDYSRLNAFVKEWNAYTISFQGGVIDVKQWSRVRDAWERLR